MHIYLIRHTAINIDSDICYGRMQVPLAADFESTREKVIARLPSLNTLFTSPSQRCMKLAQAIQATSSTLHITQDDRLLEFNYGAFEGRRWQELGELAAFQYWADNWMTAATPGGESIQDVILRVNQFIHDLRKDVTDDSLNIGVVTHHGVIRAFLANILTIPLTDFFKMRFDYASVTCVQIGRDAMADQVVFK